jgi:hypothetical protein
MIFDRLRRAIREQNWFTVVLEICIVMLGVVIGFQVTAWGQARGDRAQEQVYLRQLAADLRETERDIMARDSLMASQSIAGAQLVRAFLLPEEPPADSILAWVTRSWDMSLIRPIMATEEALVATGDLALIRTDSLRTAITAHLEMMRVSQRVEEDLVGRWRLVFQNFVGRFDPVALNTSWRSQEELDAFRQDPLWPYAADARRDRFSFDVRDFLSDREAFNEAESMRNRRRQLATNRAMMLHATTALREQVEAELNR